MEQPTKYGDDFLVKTHPFSSKDLVDMYHAEFKRRLHAILQRGIDAGKHDGGNCLIDAIHINESSDTEVRHEEHAYRIGKDGTLHSLTPTTTYTTKKEEDH